MMFVVSNDPLIYFFKLLFFHSTRKSIRNSTYGSVGRRLNPFDYAGLLVQYPLGGFNIPNCLHLLAIATSLTPILLAN